MSDMYTSYKKESMGIAYSVGKEIAGKLIDLINEELAEDAVVAKRVNDLSQALRNCLAVTGSKQAEADFLADEEKG